MEDYARGKIWKRPEPTTNAPTCRPDLDEKMYKDIIDLYKKTGDIRTLGNIDYIKCQEIMPDGTLKDVILSRDNRKD
jgi:hypothetical protein